MTESAFQALGHPVTAPTRRLETFPAPAGVTQVQIVTQELTAFCPVTGQPDFYTLCLTYEPDQACLESKSLKLYVWSFREERMFAEALAAQVARDVWDACQPHFVRAELLQNVRGGLALTATAELARGLDA